MPRESKWIIFVAVLASLLEIIDTSIVNVAIPSMMGNLGATLADISWVVTGYIIANAIVLPLSGWAGERIGRRKYYIGCIILFTATSVACGLAPNLFTLTLFRILQGLAGGALLPTSQTLIYEQFPKEKAGIAGAIFGMSVMIGPTLGPTLGGYLTDQFGWRMIFNINLPLGLLAAFVAFIYIKEPVRTVEQSSAHARAKSKPIDMMGLALLALGIGCLQYVLERGEADDWFSSTGIVVTTLIAAVCLPAFVAWELKVEHPIVNLRLFKNPLVVNGTLLMAALGFFLYGIIFMLPVFVSRVFHYDATQIGMLFIPGSILTAVLMPFIGKAMGKYDPKKMIFIGLVSLEICMVMMTQFSSLSSHQEIINTLFMRGFGMAFLFVPINSSILSQFSGPALGQVAGLMNLLRQIGGSIGIALIGTLLTVNSNQNYLDLVTHVSLLKPATQQAYFQMSSGMSHKMSSAIGMAEGSQAALKSIYYRVQNQAFMMSFNQLLYVIMIIFAFSLIPLYRLQLRSKPTGAIDAH